MRIEAENLKTAAGITHGFFTREGGVSGGLYASLNCGLGSKDRRENVLENRRRVADALGVAPDRLISPSQFHSTEVFVAESAWAHRTPPRADALVTAQRGLAIGVQSADCLPVLFADVKSGVVGAAHAGWRGALAGVLEATVATMEALGAARDSITAAMGPAISQDAYEVGEAFEQTFLDANPENTRFFKRPGPASRPHFDLPGYAAARLECAGIAKIEELSICTYPAENRLFSYRRTCHRKEDDYGRQISAIVIPR